ncbi:MAG: succinylglutamate desuccinylase/aspartoacylase family protein [Alphaproteobacteria bacterium]
MQPEPDSPARQRRPGEASRRFARPDLRRFAEAGTPPYVVTAESGRAGPNVVLSALMHGNELCGAIALCRLIERGFVPLRGRLSFAFANVEAYESFDPERPFASRYLDEDLNRVWRGDILDLPSRSREHARAKALRALMSGADALLDLHSTSSDSAPMILCGRTAKGLRLAGRLGLAAEIVRDDGHAKGPRLIDFDAFADNDRPELALLVECGQHFDPSSAEVALEAVLRFLLAVGSIEAAPAWAALPGHAAPQHFLDVTHPVTIQSDGFVFVRPLRSLERIARAGTLIAYDGGRPIATPYDDCVAVMPSLAPARGETAVRLARVLRFPAEAGAPPR